jgi:hypothetical protein
MHRGDLFGADAVGVRIAGMRANVVDHGGDLGIASAAFTASRFFVRCDVRCRDASISGHGYFIMPQRRAGTARAGPANGRGKRFSRRILRLA